MAAHADDGIVNWKGAHTALRGLAHMGRRTVNTNPDNLRTRWRKLKTLQLHCSLRTLPLDPHFPLRLEDPRLPLRPE